MSRLSVPLPVLALTPITMTFGFSFAEWTITALTHDNFDFAKVGGFFWGVVAVVSWLIIFHRDAQ